MALIEREREREKFIGPEDLNCELTARKHRYRIQRLKTRWTSQFVPRKPIPIQSSPENRVTYIRHEYGYAQTERRKEYDGPKDAGDNTNNLRRKNSHLMNDSGVA